ncbi:MAG: aldehyde dehydrogenase family protein [Deltaproteobacteria bacterium]|nr:aldehyde dehydrogenase family protein [Deltaproteobacteria bacterium]
MDGEESVVNNNIAWQIGSAQERSTEIFESRNPACHADVLGVFGCATREQIAKAGARAEQAFTAWRKTPAPVRAGVVANFGRLLEANKESLARLVTREMGKPIREARGDVQEAIDTCSFFVGEGRRLYGMTVPSEMPNKELYTYRRPVGVFACMTAGNFPVAVPSWYFVPALVAGNVCLWKPSEDAPLTSYYFAMLLEKAGCPAGVFQVVYGKGADSTGAWLIEAIDAGWISAFGFTGSSQVGARIGEVCGRNLITPCLELGGKNPMVVMPDADLALAVEGALWSGFGTAGQRCTSLGNLIVHEKIRNRFVERLLEKVATITIGDPLDESVLYGPMISEKFLHTHLHHLETLIAPHHTVLTRSNGRITAQSPWPRWRGKMAPDDGWFAAPTVVDGVRSTDPIYAQETFGPLINVMTCRDLDEAIALANGTGYGLSSALYTNTPSYVYHWKEEITAGMTSINNSTTGAEAHLPFGGNGRSGNGSRQSGVWVLDQCTRWQAVNWDLSGALQHAQIETGYIAADVQYRLPC